MNGTTSTVKAAQAGPGQAIAAVIAGDESGLRRLAELLAPYLPPVTSVPEPDGWLSTREAAEYAGTTVNALHKAMSAREIHFEQDTRGGRGWFKRSDIDAWRRGKRADRRAAA